MRTALMAVCVGVLGVSFAWASGPVRTPEADARVLRSPVNEESFSFAVLGDRVPGSDAGLGVLERAVETINLLGVRFVMTTGNMVDGRADAAKWADRVNAYRLVMSRLGAEWYPVPGALDTAVESATSGEAFGMYRTQLGPMTYSFGTGWAHVIVLSSEVLSRRGPERESAIAWLAGDLRSTDAEQVFVFIHEPMWLGPDRGLWDDVHGVLSADRRPKRVISGGRRYARDDGQRDNVRYCTVAMTGAFASGTHGYASSHAVTLVNVTRRGHALTVLPFDAAEPGGAFLSSDADAVHALAETGWVSVEGFVQAGPEAGDGAGFEVVLENPTDKRFEFGVEARAPSGWVLSRDRIAGAIGPGQTIRLPISAESPPLDRRRPEVGVVVTARYPVASGGVQPVIRSLDVPVRPRGAEEVAGAAPDRNGVLSLKGRGAVRVDLGERPWRLTVECWVKSNRPGGSMTLISRLGERAGFGLVWSRPGGVLPAGLVGTDRGVVRASLAYPPDWGAWRHVALTYDGRQAVIYIDGEEAGRSEAGGELLHPDLPLYIGAEPNDRGDAVSMFSGLIDEVRVSSAVRYEGPFTPARTFETDEHTLLLMHFDTPYYGAFPDDSGRGHHGWVVGEAEIEWVER